MADKTNIPFVHLHFHSEFSLLDGANPIGKSCERAADGVAEVSQSY